MADEDRSFAPNTVQANRARMQGLGVGQEEMDLQRDPNPDLSATDAQRTEPFDESLDPTTNADRPSEADFSGQEPGDVGHAHHASASGTEATARDDRDSAGLGEAGDLGVSTPPGVDVHDLAQEDNPEEDWGEPADEGAIFSSNHTRRPVRTDAERGQGAKTRQLSKDIISRRT